MYYKVFMFKETNETVAVWATSQEQSQDKYDVLSQWNNNQPLRRMPKRQETSTLTLQECKDENEKERTDFIEVR